MKNPNNRFSKIAGLFDSPIISPQKSTIERNDKPLKKWDETTTRRFIAIQEIRKEIKYFAADFENWARDQFGADAPESDYATKLSKKLNKAEAVLYAITNQMSELAKTGEIPAEFVKLASTDDADILAEGWDTKADDSSSKDINEHVEYSLEYEVSDKGWELKAKGSGFKSTEDAESDIDSKIKPLIENMNLVCDEDENECTSTEELLEDTGEERDEEPDGEESNNDESEDIVKEAQRAMNEGSPRGAWVDVNLDTKKLKEIEDAFTHKGIFTQILDENTLRVRNSADNISQKIVDVLKTHKVKFSFVDPYSGETYNG